MSRRPDSSDDSTESLTSNPTSRLHRGAPEMGIKGLTKLLSANAPDCIKHIESGLAYYRGKKIAFDASMHIYQFMTSIRTSAGETLLDPSGNPTSHIQGMLSRVVKVLEAGILPVFVFDGEPPEAKKWALDKRKAVKAATLDKLQEAREAQQDEVAASLQRRTYSLSDAEVEDCKRLLHLLGVPVVQAQSEAEAQCATMCRDGLVDAVSTEDMDTLAFGAPVLIRNMFSGSAVAGSTGSQRQAMTEIRLDVAIRGLGLVGGMEQFADLCILCGCDYCGTIPGIGPVRALQRIKEHGNIDGVLASLVSQSSSSATHEKLRDFRYQDAKRLFANPPVHRSEDLQLEWRDPDVSGLVAFLVFEKGFTEARVMRYLDKVVSGRAKRGQTTIDTFFGKRQ